MKKYFRIIFCLTLLTACSLFCDQESAEQNLADYQKEIVELDTSISALKKWQTQYQKKQKSFEAHRKRVLFRNKSPKDAQRADGFAQEAKENALELQTQIDMLESRKKGLIEAQL